MVHYLENDVFQDAGRDFIRACAVLAAAFGAPSGTAWAAEPVHDVVIRNAVIYDGSGGKPRPVRVQSSGAVNECGQRVARQQRAVVGSGHNRDRLVGGARDDVRAGRKTGGGHETLASRAAPRQELPGASPRPDLQQLPAKDVLHRLAEKLGLHGEERTGDRGAPPGRERRILIGHA